MNNLKVNTLELTSFPLSYTCMFILENHISKTPPQLNKPRSDGLVTTFKRYQWVMTFLWATMGLFTRQNLGPTKPSKEILGSSCNSCHGCFHVVSHKYWQFDAIWCRFQEKPSTGNQWPLSSVTDTQEVQMDKWLFMYWLGRHKSQQNTGSTLLKLQRHLLSYMVKTTYFKRQYLYGTLFKTGLHFSPFFVCFSIRCFKYWILG